MIVEKLSPLILLGLFFVYRSIFSITLTPFVKYLLSGPFRQIQVYYFEEVTKERFDSATRQNNPNDAWEQIALAKIREMGHPKTSYEKRRQNLLYLRNTVPTKKVAYGLAEVLPYQRNLSFQQELACYLCNILDEFRSDNAGYRETNLIVDPLDAPFKALNNLFSAWFAGLSILIFFWSTLDRQTFGGVAIHSALAFALMFFPILQVRLKLRTVLSYALFSASVILISLALFAFLNHSGVNQKVIELDEFGYGNSIITINYPKWLTIDEIQSCGRSNAISVLLEGNELPGSLVFDFDETLFSALDDQCKLISPKANEQNASGTAFTFYLAPRDRESLVNPEVALTPILQTPDDSLAFDDYRMHIGVEKLHWGLVRQSILLIASGGGISFLALGYQLLAALRKP